MPLAQSQTVRHARTCIERCVGNAIRPEPNRPSRRNPHGILHEQCHPPRTCKARSAGSPDCAILPKLDRPFAETCPAWCTCYAIHPKPDCLSARTGKARSPGSPDRPELDHPSCRNLLGMVRGQCHLFQTRPSIHPSPQGMECWHSHSNCPKSDRPSMRTCTVRGADLAMPSAPNKTVLCQHPHGMVSWQSRPLRIGPSMHRAVQDREDR